MSIAFEELAGSPRIRVSAAGVEAVRSFRVAWADWTPLVRALVGVHRAVGQATQFVSPLGFPGLPHLTVIDVAVEPFDPERPDGTNLVSLGARTNAYAAGALVTATYRTQLDDPRGGRADAPRVPTGTYLIYTAELGLEAATLPARVWNWRLDGDPKLPEDQGPTLYEPTGTHQLTWLRVPRPPWAAIRATRGKLNATSFLGAPPQTLLFAGARAAREFEFLEEVPVWRVEYTFLERVRRQASGAWVGWNHHFRQEPEGDEHWLEIEDESGRAPYATADFAPLFELGD